MLEIHAKLSAAEASMQHGGIGAVAQPRQAALLSYSWGAGAPWCCRKLVHVHLALADTHISPITQDAKLASRC